MQSSLNQTEIEIFGALMRKDLDDLRIRFLEEYQILMTVWEDDFFERFGSKLKCAVAYMCLKDTDQALREEIKFTNSN